MSLRVSTGEEIVSRESSLPLNLEAMLAGVFFQLFGWGLLLWMYDLLPTRGQQQHRHPNFSSKP